MSQRDVAAMPPVLTAGSVPLSALANQPQNRVLAGPASGGPGAVGARQLVAADLDPAAAILATQLAGGILAAQLAGGILPAQLAAPGANLPLVQLGQTTLGGTTAGITFSSIPAGYSALVLLGALRGATVAVVNGVALRFNGDTGANYDTQSANSTGATVTAATLTAQTSAGVGACPGASATANVFNHCFVIVPDYASARQKGALVIDGFIEQSGPTGRFDFVAAAWRGTAAITSVTLLESGGAGFVSGSNLTLYGAF